MQVQVRVPVLGLVLELALELVQVLGLALALGQVLGLAELLEHLREIDQSKVRDDIILKQHLTAIKYTWNMMMIYIISI